MKSAMPLELRRVGLRLAERRRERGTTRSLGQRVLSRPVRLRGELPRALDPELAHVGALAVTLIAASWLSKCIVGAGHVEYVVDDLEQHAELGGEAAEGGCLGCVCDPRQQ